MPAYWNGTAAWDNNYEPDGSYFTAYLVKTDGTVYHHSNKSASDHDWLRFTAREGNTYTFAFSNKMGADFYFRVYDSGLRDLSNYKTSTWRWTCPVSGTYYVQIYDHDANNIGSVDFSITGDELDYAIDIVKSRITLYLDPTFGVDTYNLVANCSNGMGSIVWSSSDTSVVTVNADGIIQARGAGTAVITATCTSGGTTDKVVITVNADDYEDNNVLAQAEPLAIGQTFQTHILKPNAPNPDSVDWVKFDAVQGYGYVIQLANETAGNVYCRLYNENGNAQTGNINSTQQWICPLSGTYYLRMWEDRNDQWTQYQVRVLPAYWNISNKPHWDDVYEPNSESYTSCFICTQKNSPYYEIAHVYNESYADLDWFRFFAVEGATYELSLTDELGGDFYFNLYDSNFNSISINQSTTLTWTCPATGIYHVKIWERDTNQKGRYYFKISSDSQNEVGVDSDADGMKDCWEIYYFGKGNIYRDGTGDWDNDQLTDKEEHDNSTNPKKIDTDNDKMPDGWEVHNNLNPLIDDTQEDPDDDKLSNIEEYNNQTLPQDSDTDGDKMPEGWEVHNKLNPLADDSSHDYDDDGLTNLQEFNNNTNPHNPDTDNDFMPDGWEVTHNLNPLVNDGFSDKDNDGFCNWREYVGGSSPDNCKDLPNKMTIYVDLNNSSGIEDGTLAHPFRSIRGQCALPGCPAVGSLQR